MPVKSRIKLTGMVFSFSEDRQGTFWLSTWNNGALKLKDGELTQFISAATLSDNNVRAVLEDREGNLWFGTNTNGLIRWRRNRITTYGSADGLTGDDVLPIMEDSRGAVWIGGGCTGVNRLQNGKFTRWTAADGVTCVRAIAEDGSGQIWIGGGNGLMQLKGERFVRFGSIDRVNALHDDGAGNLWIGAVTGLHCLKDGAVKSWSVEHGLAQNDVRFITTDEEGALWVGTTGGLSRFKDGKFTSYTTDSGLSQNHVRAIHADRDGTLWVGTYGGGLNRFRAGKFVPITQKDGLFDNVVSRILEDGRDNLWMTGIRGVFRVSRRELNDFADGRGGAVTSVSYGVADGMPASETNGGGQPAGWKMRDGRLWFPTIKGVAVFDPNEPDASAPPVFIEQVALDGKTFNNLSEVRIEPGQGNLELQYTGLNFSRPEQVRFKYQLAGLDDEWVDAGTRRTAYYSHLPPGSYAFKVIAVAGDGIWNTEGASIKIIVVAPFYRRWWFIALCLAMVTGLATFGYRWRVAQLKRKQAAQEVFSRRLIDSQEQERQRIAAELHDSLGQSLLIIKNRIALARGDIDEREVVEEQLDELSQSASAAIEECREIAYNLRPFQIERFGLSKTLSGIFTRINEVTNISALAEIDPIDDVLTDEAQINVYRIVQECVNNVIKHSHATEATLVIKRNQSGIALLMQDNGVGFEGGVVGLDGAKRSGFGLVGIAERVKMLGGSLQIDSTQGTSIKINLTTGVWSTTFRLPLALQSSCR